MITISHRGSFKNTESFLRAMLRNDMFSSLDNLAREGVDALSSATPEDSGLTAASWNYEVQIQKDVTTITWTNDHLGGDVPVAILLQYGHGTGTGGYVEGQDYINPAIRPVFDKIADRAWKVVTNS